MSAVYGGTQIVYDRPEGCTGEIPEPYREKLEAEIAKLFNTYGEVVLGHLAVNHLSGYVNGHPAKATLVVWVPVSEVVVYNNDYHINRETPSPFHLVAALPNTWASIVVTISL